MPARGRTCATTAATDHEETPHAAEATPATPAGGNAQKKSAPEQDIGKRTTEYMTMENACQYKSKANR